MSNYIQIHFHDLKPEQIDILIATLSGQGFEGFEESGSSLTAFISEQNFDEHSFNEIAVMHGPEYSKSILPSTNWNKQWESGFTPVVLEDFVAVRAGFHEPITNVQHEIIITPKMSFGTGHHATTVMMMRQMKEIDFNGKSVFDFGTGTAILAILAEKLGAEKITAVDNDDWSITNAAENIQANNCDRIILQKAGSMTGKGGFDVILANITKNIILENFELIVRQLNKNGILLLSGLLEDDEDEILNYSKTKSLILYKKLREGNWLCLSFLR